MYKRNQQEWLKHLDFILLDEVALQLAFILAFIIRSGLRLPYASPAYRALSIMLVAADFLVAVLFRTMHNVLKRGYYQEALYTFKQVVLVFLTTTLFLFTTQSGYIFSRIILYLLAFFHFLIGYTLRLLWKPVVRKIWKMSKKASMILVADEQHVDEIISRAKPTDEAEYTGIVLTNRDATGEVIGSIPVVANLENAADFICREWVDEVFVYPAHLSDIEVQGSALYKSVEGIITDTYPEFVNKDYEAHPIEEPEDHTVAGLIESCRQMAIPVHIRLPISNMSGKSFVEKVNGYNVLTTSANYSSPMQFAMKRLMDILGGLIGSFIALVVIAVAAPMIKKESPGPILFKQTRIGMNGKKFQIYKIRSMYQDAEARKAELMKDNRVSDGMMFKLDWDPRIIGNKIVDGKQVTGIGEKLRSGSWDEWPQFFNILMGQMSLVGTRPPTVDEWEKYKYHHRARLSTKPGLTGMWQVSGRSKITDFEEVVRLDTEYINHWSISLDIRILLKTVKAVFTKDGAM